MSDEMLLVETDEGTASFATRERALFKVFAHRSITIPDSEGPLPDCKRARELFLQGILLLAEDIAQDRKEQIIALGDTKSFLLSILPVTLPTDIREVVSSEIVRTLRRR